MDSLYLECNVIPFNLLVRKQHSLVLLPDSFPALA